MFINHKSIKVLQYVSLRYEYKSNQIQTKQNYNYISKHFIYMYLGLLGHPVFLYTHVPNINLMKFVELTLKVIYN